MSTNNDKPQILKLISSVLDFNQQESDKVGLNKTHSGWLNSILHGGNEATRQGQSNGMLSFTNFKSNTLIDVALSFVLLQKITIKTV